MRVACALIVREGLVLCTQRGPGMSLPFQWEFPGGKVEAGETAEACIVREISEELSLGVRVVERGPSVFHPFREGEVLELIPFVCEWVGGEMRLSEHVAARWCGVGELGELDWAEADLGVVAWWRGRGK
jgi:8-oxo-dGTP diphosphatase